MQRYKKIIEQTLATANLPREEALILEKELQSHFFETERNLLLQGKDEKKAIDNFGDPKIIGHYIRKIKYPWEKIPILGDLIYYPPFRLGFKYSFLQLLTPIFGILSFLIIVLLSRLFYHDILETEYSDDIFFGSYLTLISFLPAFLGVFFGLMVNKKIKKLSQYFEFLLIALLPFVCIFVLIIAIQYYFNSNTQLMDELNLKFVGVCLGSYNIMLTGTYLILLTFNKFKKKYAKSQK